MTDRSIYNRKMTMPRWQTLMESLGINSSIEVYDQLHTAYSEKHRYYHTIDHIDAMLSHLDAVKELAEKPSELELAIWFHDAVYKPFSKNNELDSANWAEQFLLSRDFDKEGAKRVFHLIMATLHNGAVQSKDQKLLVDIDLTILGSDASVYDEFERNVRKEYRLVPSFIFRKNRKKLLTTFLNQPRIYHLDEFYDRYESKARDNVVRAIRSL